MPRTKECWDDHQGRAPVWELTYNTFFTSRRSAVLWVLIAFVVTGLATRIITRRIRSAQRRRDTDPDAPEKWPHRFMRNIHISGIHVHHQVWGNLMVLTTGLIAITYQPSGIALTIVAILFGTGAALALDEFAMWLHLEDVYWSQEGRKSISAMMTAASIALVLVLGSNPLGIGSDTDIGAVAVAAGATVSLVLAGICILKGKLQLGIVGIFLPFLSTIGSVRLAKPDSWWARRNYRPGSRKDRRSRARFDEAYYKRWERLHDLIGGEPDPAPHSPHPYDEIHAGPYDRRPRTRETRSP